MKEKICCPERLNSDILSTFKRKQHRDTYQVVLSCLMQAIGRSGFNASTARSPSSISHFLNDYKWPIRDIIRVVRKHTISTLNSYLQGRRGRPSKIDLIVDTTSIAKEGKIEAMDDWIHTLNNVRGLHIVVLYICCGELRLPWGFAIWQGKDKPTTTDLALRLIKQLPKEIISYSKQIHLLADAGFGVKSFIRGIKDLNLDATIGMRGDRLTVEGKHLRDLDCQGRKTQLKGLEEIDVWVYWVHLAAKKGEKQEKRYIISTRWHNTKSAHLLGKRRWKIEALFKTLKSRFAFGKFAQRTKLGVLRYLCLSLLCFILTHFEYLSHREKQLPNQSQIWPAWGKLAKAVQHKLFGWVQLFEIKREEKMILSCPGQPSLNSQ